jgi:anti-sigma regulatory factor (Ser/Thr protein kinase)
MDGNDVGAMWRSNGGAPDMRLWQGICVAAQQLVEGLDLRQALEAIVHNVRHSLAIDRVGIFYYDRGADHLVRLIGIDHRGEIEDEGTDPIPVGACRSGPLRQVVRGEISHFYSHDVRADVPDIRFDENVRAHAIVPLLAGGQIIGAMCVDNLLTERDIQESVLQPLCLFGHFGAIALHNALRHRELLQAEAQKKQFYRDVVYSVTNGKLVLCDREELESYWPEAIDEVEIRSEGDIRRVRGLVQDVGKSAGMQEQRIYDLGLCASEAATNALKHGEGGRAAITRAEERVRVLIEDNGGGIDPDALPRATLLKGFSTRASMGLGFTIMHELADKIYLHTGAGGTAVILEMGIEAPTIAELPLALLNWDD